MTKPKPKPIVFFSRCKPWGVDALDVALEAKRIFFGHCMRVKDAAYNPNNLKACIVDVTCGEEEWKRHHAESGSKKKQFNQNRNFVGKIARKSIALIPRPSKGVVYCGFVEGAFELIDNPPAETKLYKTWADTWEKGREANNKLPTAEEAWIAGEIAQTWKVDEFRPIPAARIPVWIRRSLFGRSTYGTVKPQFDLDPYKTMTEILDEQFSFEPKSWTKDPDEIKHRLITDFTPNAFEHLVVALLQLEHPEEMWTHVGGSGDGGADGMGNDSSGKTVGLLQCKWVYRGEKIEFSDAWEDGKKSRRCDYLASIHHDDDVKAPGDPVFFLTKEKIAELLIKHATRLPQAIALRVGDEPDDRQSGR